MRKKYTYDKLEDLNYTSYGEEEDDEVKSNWNSFYIKLLVIIIFSIIFLGTINLQVVNGSQNRVEAELNRVASQTIIADRGIILDKNGIPLIYNIPAYKLYLKSAYLNSPSLLNYLNTLSPILNQNINSLTKLVKNTSTLVGNLQLISSNLSKTQMLQIINSKSISNIFTIISYTKRDYSQGDILSSILGYTGEVSADNLKNDTSLVAGDSIGKDGLEYYYNKYLKGEDGQQNMEVNTNGQVVGQLSQTNPLSGDTLKLAINLTVQQEMKNILAQGLIDDTAATGAVGIVEDVNTGEIISMVTLPTFNDNDFVGGISESKYQALLSNPNFPMLDRAIAEAQPPGSVMKTITAPAALETGAITLSTQFDSEGVFKYKGVEFQDYNKKSWGILNVIGGLKDSSNIFFFHTILSLGIKNLVTYQNMFGLGQLTGIDLPGEVLGTISDPQTKQRLTGQVWYPGDSLNAAIGQGYTTVTPIQIVNWISSIANGGTLLKPHVVDQVISSDGTIVKDNTVSIIRNLSISSKNLDIVKQGMRAAVTDGVDVAANSKVVEVAGKTGTAEFGTKNDKGVYSNAHAWFTGFAPYTKPKIAIVIFLESGGLSTNASTIAHKFFDWYFGQYYK